MAKRTRAATRGAAAQPTKRGVKEHVPVRAIQSRRLQFTPALIADVRRRYERTDEPLATLAADLGCSIETVRNIAGRENWLRYAPPPRDLTPAARLAARAKTLAAHQSPFVPAHAGTQNQARDADGLGPGSPRARGRTDVAPGSPLEPALGPAEGRTRVRGRTDDDSELTESASEPPQEQPLRLAVTAEALHRELQTLLAELTATRARMKRERSGKHDLRQMAQVIASLTATLRALQPMLCPDPQAGADPNDDMPADIDEFRNELARRIDAFVASRTEPGDAGGDSAAPVDAA